MAGGHHIIPFCASFPVLSYSRLVLPPTLSINLPHLRAAASYFVQVEISRPGFLRCKLKRKMRIDFRPSSLAPIHPQFHPILANTNAMLAADDLNPQIIVPYQPPCLPRYSPSLRVELNIPSPAVLFPGEPLNMGLSAIAQGDLLGLLGVIRLRRLAIGLRVITTVQVGLSRRTTASYVQIYSMAGDMVIAQPDPHGCMILSESALWSGHLIPEVLPTFNTPHIARRYMLEALVGFSSGQRNNVEVSLTCSTLVRLLSLLTSDY